MKKQTKEELCNNVVNPDHELLLWEKWIRIRKEETTRLGEATGRPPTDLVMNQLKDIREDKERKIALENAKIEPKPIIRGTLFEQPLRLKQDCYCDPVYEVHRTPSEMGRPRIIKHIGMPKHIQEAEAGISGVSKRAKCTKLNTDYVKYRTKRETELKGKIEKIDPFRPDVSQLIVIGKKPEIRSYNALFKDEITIQVNEAEPTEDVLANVYALRINDSLFYKEIPGQTMPYAFVTEKEAWHKPCTSWTYYFNVPYKRTGRSKIILQNLGTVTLRYCWKKMNLPIQFIPEDEVDQVFFFNKNEDVIAPGQRKEIYLTFVSKKPGIYNESWEFNLSNLNFFDNLSQKLIVNLSGDAIEYLDIIKKRVNILRKRVDLKAVYNSVRVILNDIIQKATTIPPLIYPYKHYFLEGELFVMKNPVCFYHQAEVAKLNQLYSEMVPGQEWDLSITTWRTAMMRKEFDERMNYYKLLRNSHADLLKPWHEQESLLKQKYRAVNLILGQLADKFYTEKVNVAYLYGVNLEPGKESGDYVTSWKDTIAHINDCDPLVMDTINNVYYIKMYDHVADTIELCAGVLSSLDLNRWIEFDFCQS